VIRAFRLGGALVSAVGLAVLVIVPSPAHAASVHVVVVPPFPPSSFADAGAVGLLVPGAGSTVTGAGALSSLVRGKVVSSLLGGRASGKPLITLSRGPAGSGERKVTVYVSLPPRGRTNNVRRYPIAVVGAGYHGLLTSTSTRIPGLVSIADVAPFAVDLAQGRRPALRWRADDDAPTALRNLDRRLRDAHDTRTSATSILVAWTLLLAGLAQALRSPFMARAALLAIPSALALALALSGGGVSGPWLVTALLAVGTGAAALAGAARERLFVPLLIGTFALGAVVLAAWPEVNALSVIGPHPDGGGRFYGVTNGVETLLLAPLLAAAAAVERAWLPVVGVLALVLVGWSRAGADGGGILVVLTALAAFWAFREELRLTRARVVLGILAVLLLGLAFVGLDAVTGGSSHVTHSVGGGPGSIPGDLGHRLHVSWNGVRATAQAWIAAFLTLLVLVVLAFVRPRRLVVDALLVALAVSLLVNDTPTEVLAFGSLVAVSLRTWADVPEPLRRRSWWASSPRASRVPRLR